MNNQEFAHTCTASPAWKQVLHEAVLRTFVKDQEVFAAGEKLHSLYYLARGQIRMDMLHPDGSEKIYWYIGPESIFGETPLLHQMPSTLRAVCTKPSDIYVFDGRHLRENLFSAHPELLNDLLYNLACKMRVMANQIATLSLDDLPVRICRYLLLSLHRDVDGTLCAAPGTSLQSMAKLLGAHRVTCSRVWRGLETSGVLSGYSRSRVVIRDEKAFRKLLW